MPPCGTEPPVLAILNARQKKSRQQAKKISRPSRYTTPRSGAGRTVSSIWLRQLQTNIRLGISCTFYHKTRNANASKTRYRSTKNVAPSRFEAGGGRTERFPCARRPVQENPLPARRKSVEPPGQGVAQAREQASARGLVGARRATIIPSTWTQGGGYRGLWRRTKVCARPGIAGGTWPA